MCELDPARFFDGEQRHGITVDQLDGRKVDGDDTAVFKRGAKDFQVVPCNPAADAQNDTPFDCQPVDPACHGFVAYAPLGQTARHTRSTENGANPRMSVDQEPVNPKNLVNVVSTVNVAMLGEFSGI